MVQQAARPPAEPVAADSSWCVIWGLGFGVWGLGFGVWGLRFGVWGLGFGVWNLESEVLEIRVWV